MPGAPRVERAERGKAGKRLRLVALWAMAAAVTVVLPSALLALRPDRSAEEYFRQGIKALDRHQWDEAVARMLEASQRKQEDGRLVRIYGTRYQSYLPHYFRGLALYNKNNCPDALKAWDESLKLGVVQQSEEYLLLNAFRLECQKRLASTP
jgi:hypothetical protein